MCASLILNYGTVIYACTMVNLNVGLSLNVGVNWRVFTRFVEFEYADTTSTKLEQTKLYQNIEQSK